MGCGCAKKMARNKRKRQETISKTASDKGKLIRKRRINKLIAVPGRSSRRKISKET